MIFIYWIKFSDRREPMKFEFRHMEELFFNLREFTLRNPQFGWIEWMIRD